MIVDMAQATSNGFTNVQDVVKFISGNPQRFLEQVNQNPDLRASFASILKTANPSEIISMAYELQDSSMKITHPITGVKTIIEPFSQRVAQWMSHEHKQLNENPFHSVESPKEKFEQFKFLDEDDDLVKLDKTKKRELAQAIIEGQKINEKLIDMALGYFKMTQEEMKRIHDMEKHIMNGDFDKLSDKDIKIMSKFTLGVVFPNSEVEIAGKDNTEKVLNASKISLTNYLTVKLADVKTKADWDEVLNDISKTNPSLSTNLRFIAEGHGEFANMSMQERVKVALKTSEEFLDKRIEEIQDNNPRISKNKAIAQVIKENDDILSARQIIETNNKISKMNNSDNPAHKELAKARQEVYSESDMVFMKNYKKQELTSANLSSDNPKQEQFIPTFVPAMNQVKEQNEQMSNEQQITHQINQPKLS